MDRNDISIGVPPGWRHTSDLEHGIVLSAHAPTAPGSGFAPTVVMDTEPVEAAFVDWRREAAAHLDHVLDGFEIEDDDVYQLGEELVGYRRVSFRGETHDLVSEQWSWLIRGVGFTLSCTVAGEDYADYTDLFEDLAATFSVCVPTSERTPGAGRHSGGRW